MCMSVKQVRSLTLIEEQMECVKEQHARQENYLDLGQNKEEIQENYTKKILYHFLAYFKHISGR